jgi:Homeodomain-like domain
LALGPEHLLLRFRTYDEYPTEEQARWRIIELLEVGFRPRRVAKLLAIQPAVVYHWKRRFAASGLLGLTTQRRVGTPITCAPQKHYWYLRPPSCGPVFDRQARDLTKVCEIAREKGRVTGHDNRRNFQVHCSDPQPSTLEPLEDKRRGFIKRQYWDSAVVVGATGRVDDD